MTDDWKIYPCQMGPDRAWIMFDHGISKTINNEAPPQLLKIRIAFAHPREDGMPGDLEFQRLLALDEDVKALAQAHLALYVGRITVARHRHFYLYTSENEAAWQTRLEVLSQRHRYEVSSYIEPDERHDGYWKELYPDENSWQVIKDMQVLEVLSKQGDDGTTSRRIEHWAYFSTKDAAEKFENWLREQGYGVKPSSEPQNGQSGVRFWHDGALGLVQITSRTIKLNRIAKEFDGTYDGCETPVCSRSNVPAGEKMLSSSTLMPSSQKPWWKFW